MGTIIASSPTKLSQNLTDFCSLVIQDSTKLYLWLVEKDIEWEHLDAVLKAARIREVN